MSDGIQHEHSIFSQTALGISHDGYLRFPFSVFYSFSFLKWAGLKKGDVPYLRAPITIKQYLKQNLMKPSFQEL